MSDNVDELDLWQWCWENTPHTWLPLVFFRRWRIRRRIATTEILYSYLSKKFPATE